MKGARKHCGPPADSHVESCWYSERPDDHDVIEHARTRPGNMTVHAGGRDDYG